MDGDRAVTLAAARDRLALSIHELWLDYFALGGSLAPATFAAILSGAAALSDHDHDLIAQALNERFRDRDQDHRLAYADELPPVDR